MEAKLREYRALRRRKELIDNAKEKLEKSKEKFLNFLVPRIVNNMEKDRSEDEVLLIENEEEPDRIDPKTNLIMEESVEAVSETSEVESFVEENQESWQYFILKWSLYGIIWVTLYIIFLRLQFGAVFFVISILIGICLNTRTRPRKKGEVSAYSVFNDNCVSIDGTLKAEQFEKEIRFGAASVRFLTKLMEGRVEGVLSLMREKLKKCPVVTINNSSKNYHNGAGVDKGYGMNVAIVDEVKYAELRNLI